MTEQAVTVDTSLAQQSIWLQHQLHPDQPTYNIPVVVRLRGPLRVDTVDQALAMVIERHEVLRSVFMLDDEVLVQVIQPPAPMQLSVTQVRSDSVSDIVRAEATVPFDLAHGPLLRMRILRLNAEEHIAVLVMHHIITDAVSSAILLLELTAIYAALSEGRVPELPEMAIQYADFAAWQRNMLQEPTLHRLSAYWSNRLARATPLELPTDRPPQQASIGRGGSYRFSLPGRLIGRLEQLARARQVSLFMVFLAGLDLLLARYTGQHDVTVMSPVAGRTRLELEAMIGCFVNPVFLRVNLDGDPTFVELLDRVRASCTGAFDHQDMPFGHVINLLRRQANTGTDTLQRQVMLSLQNAGRAPLRGAGLVFEPMEVDTGTAKFDLLLDIEPGPDRYDARLEYNTDLFEADTIAGMARHLRVILESVASSPHLPVSRTPMVTKAEESEILRSWRASPVNPVDSWVDGCLTRWWRERPDTAAVVCGDEVTDYASLHERAANRATLLRAHGMLPGDTVVLLLRPTTELVVTLCAVLHAGGRFLVLDPADPAARIQAAIAAADPTLVVNEPDDTRLAGLGIPIISARATDVCRYAEPAVPLLPDAVVQLHYLPVEVGRHALVPTTQAQLASTAETMAQALRLRADDRCLALIPGPDLMVADVFAVLSTGATLVLPASTSAAAGSWSWAQVAGVDATCVLSAHPMPPSHSSDGQPLVPPRLRKVVLSSDPVLSSDEQRWWQSWSGRLIRLHRFIGNGTFAMRSADLDRDPAAAWLPVGRPLSNRRWYVLDRDLRPLPSGVVGELYVDEADSAAAFWHEPRLTAETLLPNPHGARPGSRLHRTGDLARYRSDGSLELLGRVDRLLDIAWCRVDPAEVELALHALDGVASCTVMPTADVLDASRLTASVLPLPGVEVDVLAIREELRRRLPPHLVPQVVMCDKEEASTTGTRNTASWLARLADQPYVAPRTSFEERIASVWAELLDVDAVGVHDNFFDLGGQSLPAVRLAARLREMFGVDMAVASDLYPDFTVAAVAKLVAGKLAANLDARRNGQTGAEHPLVALPREPGELRFRASPVQEGVWARLTPDLPPPLVLSGIRVRGALDVERLRQVFVAVAVRHETLRSTYREADGELLQVISPEARIPVAVRDADPDEYAEIVRAEVDREFDLENDVPVRVVIVRFAEDDHAVVVVLHHLIGDGRSIEILARDTWAYYSGRGAELPQLPAQFADFAQWHHALLAGPRADEQISYWVNQLAGATPTTIPSDLTPSDASWSPATMLETPIPLQTFHDIVRVAADRRVTLYLVGLTALSALFARWTGDREICLRAPVFYRDDSQVQDLIADFSNDVVIRLDLSGEPTFEDLLRQVEEVTASGFTHRELPPHLLEPHLPDPDLMSRLSRIQFTTEREMTLMPTIEGLAISPYVPPFPYSYRPLRIRLRYGGDGPRCLWLYQQDLFSRERIERLAADYVDILAEMAADLSRGVAP
ncbi:condensation domain-containing protein [Streptomyces anulatus]|uniref:condensation domain-containing protein n=1 Tax=Streptomyces anulatus TaxID=1892 RepID=UPI0036AFBE1D